MAIQTYGSAPQRSPTYAPKGGIVGREVAKSKAKPGSSPPSKGMPKR